MEFSANSSFLWSCEISGSRKGVFGDLGYIIGGCVLITFAEIIEKMGKFNEIIKSDIPTLVDFYATWCGPCQMMHPVLDRLKQEMGDQVRVLKIDVDKNPDVADKFKIRGVPTFILFKKGEIQWRQSGGMDINTLKNKIRSAI